MKVLGALLAGGKSERFGSDKAFAMYQGQYLIDHAIALLKPQCDAMVICGRRYKAYQSIKDDPADYGPIGAINAALKYAKEHGFDAIISFPCDTIMGDTILGDTIIGDTITPDTPDNNAESFHWFKGDSVAYYIDQPVIGYWPCILSDGLDEWLKKQKRRSMKAWIEYIGSEGSIIKAIDPNDRGAARFININRPQDLKFDAMDRQDFGQKKSQHF